MIIEPLDKKHDRKSFHCGNDSLDRYLKKQAGQDIKRKISTVFIAAEPDTPERVIGYYTLSSFSINLEQLPEDMARKLPGYPVPAALIGRLAVNLDDQRHGVGRMLLADAVKRVSGVSREIAFYTMIVDAIDENARHFYENFGFTLLPDEEKRLFLPLKSFSAE